MLNIPLIHEAIDEFILTNPTEDYHVRIEKDDRQRPYLGGSEIGHSCENYLFLKFRHTFKESFPGRLLRLFRRGDREEMVFLWLLAGIGCEVFERDEDGKQYSIQDWEGHFKGNLDGVAIIPDKFWLEGSKPHAVLLEFKTAASKKFGECVKQGVENWQPKYFAQQQVYCGYKELTGSLFCVVNKDNDELYFEYVPWKKAKFKRLVDKAGGIIQSRGPMQKTTEPWKHCGYCAAAEVCLRGAPSLKHCRSCKWAVPGLAKSWECEKGRVYGEVCEDYVDIARG